VRLDRHARLGEVFGEVTPDHRYVQNGVRFNAAGDPIEEDLELAADFDDLKKTEDLVMSGGMDEERKKMNAERLALAEERAELERERQNLTDEQAAANESKNDNPFDYTTLHWKKLEKMVTDRGGEYKNKDQAIKWLTEQDAGA
jgi:hypothetical protein